MAERRRDHRYVVEGVEAIVNGRAAQIIDISANSVRLAADGAPEPATASIVFRTSHPVWAGAYAAEARLVRSDAISCVYAVSPPRADWGQFIRDHNVFQGAKLTADVGL